MSPPAPHHPNPHDVPAPILADEASCVARIRAGDEVAFAELFRALFPPLRNFAGALVHAPDVAEEIVQDVFFAIWTHRARWEVQTTVRSYLYTAVRNQALTWLRHQRMEVRWQGRVAQDTLDLAGARTANSAEERLRTRDLAAAIQRALDSLSLRRREAFVLRQTHHLSYAEIAAVMGIAETTVQLHMSAALAVVRETLTSFLAREGERP